MPKISVSPPSGRHPLIGLLVLALAGCGGTPPPTKPPLLKVKVAKPLTDTVSDFDTFTGRTEPYNLQDVRSQVTGLLAEAYFTEGGDVKEGDLLFKIDQRPFKAQLDKAEAEVQRADADLKSARRDYDRAISLQPGKNISQAEYDKALRDYDVANAALLQAKASREVSRVSYDYTEIHARYSGRISKRMIDPGNVVKADDTLLATIVTLDPMYASFFVDERTLLKVRRLIEEGKVPSARVEKVPVQLGLTDEAGFPHKGTINFIDNQVDPFTGTLRVRGVFDNPKKLLSPGFFVRVQVPIGPAYKALLVSEAALGTDQGRKFLYVVDDKNKVSQRKVEVGALQGTGLRVITKGLEPHERVVVDNLQRVRAGAEVEPTPVDMPAQAGERPALVTNPAGK